MGLSGRETILEQIKVPGPRSPRIGLWNVINIFLPEVIKVAKSAIKLHYRWSLLGFSGIPSMAFYWGRPRRRGLREIRLTRECIQCGVLFGNGGKGAS